MRNDLPVTGLVVFYLAGTVSQNKYLYLFDDMRDIGRRCGRLWGSGSAWTATPSARTAGRGCRSKVRKGWAITIASQCCRLPLLLQTDRRAEHRTRENGSLALRRVKFKTVSVTMQSQNRTCNRFSFTNTPAPEGASIFIFRHSKTAFLIKFTLPYKEYLMAKVQSK